MDDLGQQLLQLQQQVNLYKQQQVQILKHLQQMEREVERLQSVVNGGEIQHQPQVVPEAEVPAATAPERPYIMQVKERLRTENNKVNNPAVSKSLEDFIGTNLISKVGILITIIGIFIGAKYAIDNELISPLMRIILGYIAGGALIGISLKLKTKYRYFSSILMGGGLAVVYFITFIAFDFYQLFPRPVAFGMMLITTAATVAMALWYNQKIIALLGQVGGYAIPFLLSDGTGSIAFLFAYISIINIGLLVLAFKKEWKILYRVAFYISWLIYVVVLVINDDRKLAFSTSLIFLSINFLIFYATFLAYKVYRKEIFNGYEVAILLVNALAFFFVGVYVVNVHFPAGHALTYFAISNALLHAVISYIIYRLQLFDKTVVQFVISLALLFFTITIPIELDGNWVTLLWTIEAMLLFLVATKNNRYLYLKISMVVAIVAILSLLQDWLQMYPYMQGLFADERYLRQPFANLDFYIQMVVAAMFVFVVVRYANQRHEMNKGYVHIFFNLVLPLVTIGLIYFNIFHEIHYAWDRQLKGFSETRFPVYAAQRTLTLLIYTTLFIATFLLLNARIIRNAMLANLFMVAAFLVNIIFLINGIYVLGELRDYYTAHNQTSASAIFLFRYVLIAGVCAMWYAAYFSKKRLPFSRDLDVPVSVVFNISLLTIICNEFVHWMDLAGYANQYKLGLTIICALYALALLMVGIAKRRKHLRISAIVLFAATILKLFIYDLVSLSTISKTIVLVILGVLLLFASFLYNKYKALLFDDHSPIGESAKMP